VVESGGGCGGEEPKLMIFGFGRMARGGYFVRERPKTGSRTWESGAGVKNEAGGWAFFSPAHICKRLFI
jgi:hypothetical protein